MKKSLDEIAADFPAADRRHYTPEMMQNADYSTLPVGEMVFVERENDVVAICRQEDSLRVLVLAECDLQPAPEASCILQLAEEALKLAWLMAPQFAPEENEKDSVVRGAFRCPCSTDTTEIMQQVDRLCTAIQDYAASLLERAVNTVRFKKPQRERENEKVKPETPMAGMKAARGNRKLAK